MNSAEEIIYQYEIQRSTVTRLNNERRELIKECDNLSIGTGPCGMDEGSLCLSSLWCGSGSFDTSEHENSHILCDYSEILEESGCEACNKSFAIKRGPLMDAKKKLGDMKRKLANFGKKLIKECKS